MSAPPSPSIRTSPTNAQEGSKVRDNFLPRANAQQLSVYFGNMRSLLNAGVLLSVALDEMGRSAPHQALRAASLDMKQQLLLGRSWSESMAAYPALFPATMVALIAAGEASGNLAEMCGQLSEFSEQEYQIQVLYNREVWYPKVLLFFSTVVFPLNISIVFRGVPISFGFREQVLIIGGVWLLWYGASWLWPVTSRGKVRITMDRWNLQLPIVKEVARSFAIAKVWRVLALLYKAGVSLPDSLRMAAQSCGNAALAESVRAVAPRLERGESLSVVLASTGEFPESAIGLLRAGEKTGDLDKTLAHSVQFIEADAKTTLLKATKTITLLLYLLVAFKIGVQVIQFWMRMSGL